MSEAHKGKTFTEETKRKMSEASLRRKERDGYIISPKTKKKISETLKGKTFTEEHKRKISEAQLGEKNPFYGKKHSEETKRKLSEIKKGEKNPFYGKHRSEETKKKISESLSGEKNHMWNPNREEVYAPYGENFYNNNLRDKKWKLQHGRDMLTGTILDPDKKPNYHHIDYNKSNDDPDNHCFISINNHARISRYQPNPIKSERYKKILQENTLPLKNGQTPKYWSQINKELFRQEKLKQLDL
ncbi:hypothetical protein LCGC14_2446580, partial [marine sediment metagenome]